MMRFEKMSRRARAGAMMLTTLAVAVSVGCSQKKDAVPSSDGGSEVVAKVNGQDLTAGQLTIALQKTRGMRPDADDGAAKHMLDQLINEEIVAQKAVAAKLDQDPKVVQQLEAARRDILARRFIEQAAETAGKPSEDAVQKFYDSRPALFAQRKVYTLQRTDIQAPAERRAEVVTQVQALKTLAKLTDWLKSQKLVSTTRQEQDASEQVPSTMQDKLATMKDGESMELPSPAGVTVITLVSVTAAPKTLADARPTIEQFLSSQGRRELIANLDRTIRDGADVQYKGRFAALSSPGGNGAMPVPAPVPAAASTASDAAPAASQNLPAKK